MPSPLTTRLTLTLAALACAITTAPAHAQGGLLRKMKEKAAAAAGQAAGEKAGEKAGDKAGRAAGVNAAGGSSFTPAAPTFDDRVVEITDARVDGMLKALATERTETDKYMQQSAAREKKAAAEKAAYDAKYREYQKASDEYERKVAAHNACTGTALTGSAETQATQRKMAANMSTVTEADAKKLQARMEDLSKRGQAARDRGDNKTMMAVTDTIQMLMQQMTGTSTSEMARMGNEAKQNMAAANKCPDPGTAPVEPEAPNSGSGDSDAQRAIAVAAAKASGLTLDQYAVMRERVAYYVSVNGEFRYSTAYAYSKGELDAMKKRLGELAPYKEQLQMGGTPTWQFENGGGAQPARRKGRGE